MMTVPTASNSIGIGHGAVLSSSRLAMEIVILGKRYKATIIPESPFDAENDRLRG